MVYQSTHILMHAVILSIHSLPTKQDETTTRTDWVENFVVHLAWCRGCIEWMVKDDNILLLVYITVYTGIYPLLMHGGMHICFDYSCQSNNRKQQQQRPQQELLCENFVCTFHVNFSFKACIELKDRIIISLIPTLVRPHSWCMLVLSIIKNSTLLCENLLYNSFELLRCCLVNHW
jgi:hypothetical protein